MSRDFYQEFILPYVGIIIKICRAYTKTEADFEDYYQEVCLQLWKSHAGYKGESKWSTWVYRITLNVCLTLQKKSTKQPEASEIPMEYVKNEAFANEQLNMLYEAIHELKPADRAIVLLYLEEKSYGEIAEIIGTNANNIGVRVNRIKKQLKEIIDAKFN